MLTTAFSAVIATLPTVHTTGVNLEGVFATAASVTLMLGAIITALTWALKNANSAQIRQVIKEEVLPQFAILRRELDEVRVSVTGLDTRVARLEGVEAGRRSILDQQARGRRTTDPLPE